MWAYKLDLPHVDWKVLLRDARYRALRYLAPWPRAPDAR